MQNKPSRKYGSIGLIPYKRYKKLLLDQIKELPVTDDAEVLRNLFDMESDRIMVRKLDGFPFQFSFSFNDGSVRYENQSQFSTEEILALLRIGVLTPSSIDVNFLNNPSPKPISVESALSSGQWSLLSTLIPLALTVENNSLILIDEPENSMHPQWQRSYLNLLNDVLEGRTGCHVLIATHSPLIAGGVSDDDGNVVRVIASDTNSSGIETEVVSAAFGWDANDVLNEIFETPSGRDASFVAMADEALKLFREDKSKSRRFKELLGVLIDAAEKLPESDQMRVVVKALVDNTQD
ncbi:AAA family ATPase [Variovorax sp. R-27]|uniref:AAA family ATPase n=1 Tax=Variovorax sp. R-27 TaxID=3404058 RepID=UPI003CF4DAC4